MVRDDTIGHAEDRRWSFYTPPDDDAGRYRWIRAPSRLFARPQPLDEEPACPTRLPSTFYARTTCAAHPTHLVGRCRPCQRNIEPTIIAEAWKRLARDECSVQSGQKGVKSGTTRTPWRGWGPEARAEKTRLDLYDPAVVAACRARLAARGL